MNHHTAQRTAALVLLALTAGACGDAVEPNRAELTEAARREIADVATALDDRWGAAAQDGDVAAALACFRPIEGFCFAYDGATIPSFDGFAELTRDSYEGRTGIAIDRIERQVSVLATDLAMVNGRCHATITGKDGSTTEADYAYGFTCTKRGDGWKIVSAYEFTLR